MVVCVCTGGHTPMQGPSVRRQQSSSSGDSSRDGGGGGGHVDASTSVVHTINIHPSAPENLQKLGASIDAVMVKPKRQYQLEWKRELDAYVEDCGIPKLHREVRRLDHHH